MSLLPYQTLIQQLMGRIKKSDSIPSSPLLLKENCKDAADCIVEILILPILSAPCETLRKSTIALTERLCRRNTGQNHFKWDKSSLSVLLKTVLDTNVKMHCKKSMLKEKALSQICNDFPEFNIFGNESASIELDVDFMYALSNLDTDESLNILKIMFQTTESDNVSDGTYEFILHTWMEKGADLKDIALYKSLTMKVKPHLEMLFLDLSKTLLSENEDKHLEDILAMQKFTQLNEFFGKCALDETCFNVCVNLLNEILIISEYNDAIQSMVTFIMEKIKSSGFTSLIDKYPSHFQTIVFYLQFDPSQLEKNAHTKPILESVLISLESLKNQNWNGFVMLMSHNLQWLEYFK